MAGRRVGSKGTNSWARGRVGHVGHAGDLTILTGGGGPEPSPQGEGRSMALCLYLTFASRRGGGGTADALGSGPSEGNLVEGPILSAAPTPPSSRAGMLEGSGMLGSRPT